MRYALGQPVRISTTIRDVTGTLVNAGTLSLTVKKPDATTQTYASPSNDGTGLYHQDIPAADITHLGHYAYVWTATGTGAGVSGSASFDVFDPFEANVLPLQDAKDALAKSQTAVTDDAELQRLTATIEAALERHIGGPIINRSITERVDTWGSPWELRLLKRPLVSVTSVTDVGTGVAVDLTDSELDTNSGFVRRKLGLPFISTGGIFTVVYVAGWGTAVPPAVAEAAAVILQHLWETQRGMSSNPRYGGAEETVTLPGFGYAIPNRAAELLAPYARVGAVA